MLAAYQVKYGVPSVVNLRETAVPEISETDILVQVLSSAITQGDRRIRSADFPGVSAIIGRLMMGFTGPRKSVPGTNFAGRVVKVGSGVKRFKVGDDVFGACDHSAHADFIAVSAESTVALLPEDASFAEAAALPYGAITALHFLRDQAELKSGERLLVIGGTGGVGRFLIQYAKHVGAEVTAVCGPSSVGLATQLGADFVVDYTRKSLSEFDQSYDVVFDTIGVSSFSSARRNLTHEGRYVQLIMSVMILIQMVTSRLFSGPKAIFGVALANHQLLEDTKSLFEEGVFKPVVGRVVPLQQVVEAHQLVDEGEVQGAVVLDMLADREVKLTA